MNEPEKKKGAPFAPSNYEKKSDRIVLYCSSRERQLWEKAFGIREVGRTGRALLNQAVSEKFNRPTFNRTGAA